MSEKKTAPARLKPETIAAIKRIKVQNPLPVPGGGTVAEFCDLGLSLLRRVWGEIDGGVPGDAPYNAADDLLARLREVWGGSDSDMVRAHRAASKRAKVATAGWDRSLAIAHEANSRARSLETERDGLAALAERQAKLVARQAALIDELVAENDAMLAELERLTGAAG